MEYLCGSIFFLAIVTVVGHLFWKLFALMFGYRVRTERRSSTSLPSANLSSDPFVVSAVHLAQVRNRGLLDAETHERVMHALQAYETQKTAPSAAIPTPHQPPPLPAIAVSPSASPAPRPMQYPVQPGANVAPTPPFAPAPIPATAPRVAPAIPRARRRTLAQVLAAFMEENNMRWGELIGGLLIVGCSIALVVSFWAEISQRPLFKFSIFTAVTAALFGLGLYSEHRWKLPTTSRGILLIATLLVPLNCLAFAALSPAGSPATFALVAQAVALIIFAVLVWPSARVLTPQWPALLSIGTILLSAILLAVRILLHAQFGTAALVELALLPIGCYIVCSVMMLRQARNWHMIRPAAAGGLFLTLGVLTFATALAMALLVSQARHLASPPVSIDWVLRQLAAIISAGGLPALATGLLLWRRSRMTPEFDREEKNGDAASLKLAASPFSSVAAQHIAQGSLSTPGHL